MVKKSAKTLKEEAIRKIVQTEMKKALIEILNKKPEVVEDSSQTTVLDDQVRQKLLKSIQEFGNETQSIKDKIYVLQSNLENSTRELEKLKKRQTALLST